MVSRYVKRLFVSLALIFVTSLFVYAEKPVQATATDMPSLSPRDKVFSRYMQEIEKAYQCIAANKPFQISFYNYIVKEEDTLFHIAARCSIPYEEIALLNGIQSSDTPIYGKVLTIPNAPGLFIPEKPSSAIGTLVKKRLYAPNSESCYNIKGEIFQYSPQERLTPTERAFFLDATLRMPLEDSVLTSHFGMRTSPITGDMKFHKGIDLAAPEGTDVFSCKSGIVANAAHDNIYGKFIVLDHDNNTQSIYAHLSKILVEKGQIVHGGTVIGKVGTTGASTGPHLHFEIRVNGAAQDPRRLLPVL